MKTALSAFAACMLATSTMAQNRIELPAPSRTGGAPLMEALSRRATNRAMDPEKSLSVRQLSDLLWAAWGVNREDGRRTAPSALNRQEIDLYVVGREGAYRYDAKAHALERVSEGDRRGEVCPQEFAHTGDRILILAADYDRMTGPDSTKAVTAGIDAGTIVENVYLYCASEGLAVVAHMTLDRRKTAEVLGLKDAQRIVIGQTVGLPAER